MKIKFADIDLESLVRALLPYNWQRECEIVQNPTKPNVVVRYTDEHSIHHFLRYSKGPRQAYFWDCYGDEMLNTSVALIALSHAPPPSNWNKPVYTLIEEQNAHPI